LYLFIFFFFQAEDGIRDRNVTGVQTCALPISLHQYEVPASEIGELLMAALPDIDEVAYIRYASVYRQFEDPTVFLREIERLRGRSEERRVGKECSVKWA